MKKFYLTTTLITLTILISSSVFAGAGPLQQYHKLNPGLTDEEIHGLQFMREEEKVARDTYIYFYSLYNVPVFNNISRSEQWHMDQVLNLLISYGIDDPVGDNEEGEFTDPELQELYDTLIDYGSESFINALYVGALIEEVDILDLEEHINESTHADIQTVYRNLQWASGNHLKAFVRQLGFQGITYTPVLLDIETYEAIINR